MAKSAGWPEVKRLEREVAAPKAVRIGKPAPCFRRPAQGSETFSPCGGEVFEIRRHK